MSLLSLLPLLLLLALGSSLAHAQGVRLVYSHQHVQGALRQYGVYPTLASCEGACLASPPGSCLGVDYDGKDRSCWFHSSATVCRAPRTMGTASHIKYTNCSLNRHALRGQHQEGIGNEESCIAACLANATCGALDFDIRYKTCWLLLGEPACGRLVPIGEVVHMQMRYCPGDRGYVDPQDNQNSQTSSVVPFNGHHLMGGLLVTGFPNKDACILQCHQQISCYAVDFDVGSNTCWQHNGQATCSLPLSRQITSTHYRMAKCAIGPQASVPLLPPALPPVPPVVAPVLPVAPRTSLSSGAGAVTCGRPARSPIGGRIVGGDVAVPHSWPWQVALRNRKSKSVRCAGTVIAPYYILTTAHCVDQDTNPANWMIYTGAHDLLRYETTRTMFTVQSVILHEAFDVNTFDNDIALLKLTRPINFNANAAPVCLPPQLSEIPPGTRCTITGWGVSEAGQRPLKQATVPIINPNLCKRNDWLGSEFTITSRMICAGYAYGGTDTCQGDSGGPLVCFLNNRWVQVGLTSFGRGCGLPQKPGVYTKVSQYIDWIQHWTQH